MTGLGPLKRYGGEKSCELSWSVGSLMPLKRPPPRTRTRASGSSSAVEWYRRGRDMLASVRQLSVTGDQSSAASTALFTPTASVFGPPPVESTVPSGNSVSVWKVREKTMGGVSRHRGVGWFMSSTYVVAVDGITG